MKMLSLCSVAGLLMVTSPGAMAQEKSPAPAAVTDTKTAVLKVVDAGAEPRVQLRYAPKVGATSAVDIRMTLTSEADAAGSKMKMALPVVVIRMEATVKGVAPGGDIEYEALFSKMGTDGNGSGNPREAEQIKSALSSLQGMTAKVVVSDRGETKSLDFKPPATASQTSPQMLDKIRDLFGQFTAPLPTEPVGTGARWEVGQTLKSAGLVLNQTIKATLKDSSNSAFNIEISVAQDAARQDMTLPGLPEGFKVELAKFAGAGTWTFKGSALSILPLAASRSITVDQEMEVSNPSTGMAPQSMKQSVNTSTTVSGAAAASPNTAPTPAQPPKQ